MINRQEIAEKIRNIGEYKCYETALYEIDEIIGTGDKPLFQDFLNRLADLIDPTCHLVETTESGNTKYVCSNCGNFVVHNKQALASIDYCLCCGSRVVCDGNN